MHRTIDPTEPPRRRSLAERTMRATATKHEVPHIAVRTSLVARQRSMRSFERLSSRVLVVASSTMAIAMTAFICVTAHLLG